MVSVLVTAATLSVLVGGIIGLTTFQANLNATIDAQSTRSLAEISWRSAAQTAVTVRPTSATDVTFVSLSGDGECTEQRWTTSTADSFNQIVVLRSQYGGTATVAGCSGTITDTVEHVILTDVGAESRFEYRNAGGRPMTFDGGTATLAADPKPATVTASRWESTTVGVVTLDATTNAGSARSEPLRITQVSQTPSLVVSR